MYIGCLLPQWGKIIQVATKIRISSVDQIAYGTRLATLHMLVLTEFVLTVASDLHEGWQNWTYQRRKWCFLTQYM